MFFFFASLCSLALIGALVTPLILTKGDDLILDEILLSKTQIKLLEDYIKGEKENTEDWDIKRKEIIIAFNQLS